MRKRRVFFLFLAIIGALIAGLIAFIQTPAFARAVKARLARYVPPEFGIQGDFEEFSVRFFPPGVSVVKPSVSFASRNILDLPGGSRVKAARIDLNFLPFQIFSRNIRVNTVRIVDGTAELVIDPGFKSKKRARIPVRWEDLLRFRADNVGFENTLVRLATPDQSRSIQFDARSLLVSQASNGSRPGYRLAVDIANIGGRSIESLGLTGGLGAVRASALVSSAGVQVDEIKAFVQGVDFEAKGAVRGDVLEGKGLALEGELDARGEMGKVLALLGRSLKVKIPGSGLLEFKGKVRGNLDRPMETLRAEGEVRLERARYADWTADEARVRGSWAADEGGGRLKVQEAVIAQEEADREAPKSPGKGGKIRVGAFEWDADQSAPVRIPVKLEQAHIQWLAAPGLPKMYPLTFRVSGDIDARLSTPVRGRSPWSVEAAVKLAVTQFQLDNQKIGKPKPLTRILSIPRIDVQGDVNVDARGMRPLGVVVSLPRSRFVATGKVDWKGGLDLHAGGPVVLDDVAAIADNELKGEGRVDAHIRGAFDDVFVDFDADLKDAHYLGLHFGAVKGRMVWDDTPNRFWLKNVQAARGSTRYSADGYVDATASTINLAAKVPSGRVEDLVPVFENLTSRISGFPKTVTGPLSATVEVSGGLSLKELKVWAAAQGTEWQYWGERVKAITLSGGYDRGSYVLERLQALKRTGSIEGRISLSRDDVYDWSFSTRGMAVSDLDLAAQLDVPVRGELVLESRGRGKEGALESESRAGLGSFVIRGQPMAPSSATVRIRGDVAEIKADVFSGQAVLDSTLALRTGGISRLKGEMSRLDFSPVLLLLNPKSMTDKSLAGQISGKMDLSFKAGAFGRLSGSLEIAQYLLARGSTKFEMSRPLKVDFEDGTFKIENWGVKGPQGLALLNLEARRGELDGRLTGSLDAAIFPFLASAVSESSGEVGLDFTLGGTLTDPTFYGRARIEGISVKPSSLEAPIENVTGALQLKKGVLTASGLQGDLAGGKVSGGGTVTIHLDRYPGVSLEGELQGPKLKIYPFQFIKVTGPVSVQGDQPPYLVAGSLTVDSALSREKVLSGRTGGGLLKSSQYSPPPGRQREGQYSKFKLKIDVEAEKNIIVKNDLIDGEAKAAVTVVGMLDAPRLLGTAEIISGRLLFKDRFFQIQSATATFDNPAVINPQFSFTGHTEINNTKIQLFAAGRVLDGTWKPELTSNPVLSEIEIINLLAVGMTSADANRLSAADKQVIERGEAASLLLNQGDFNRELKEKSGFQVELDESVDASRGQSAFSSKADVSAAPKIVIKRRLDIPGTGIAPQISAGRSVGGVNNETEISGEVEILPGVSGVGVFNNYETQDASGNRTSWGADLKWQKTFK